MTAQPAGTEFRVNTYTTYYQVGRGVAIDSIGNFVVTWQSFFQDGHAYGVFAQRYGSSGSPLGAEFRVNAYTTDDQKVPTVTSAPAGSFVVVWSSTLQDGFGDGIFGRRYSSAGVALAAEFRVNTQSADNQRIPSVASDSGGEFVVVWESYGNDGSHYGVFAQRYGASGAPSGTEFRVNTYTSDRQRFPLVARQAAGSFVVVWDSLAQDGSNLGVFGQLYNDKGIPIGGEFRINSYTTNAQLAGGVAFDSSGNFVVVWQSNAQDGSGYGIFGQRFGSSAARIGGEFAINSITSDHQRAPSVSVTSDGGFVVVWEGDDGNGYGVKARRFLSSGAPDGSEFRVNTTTTDYQTSAAVAAGPGGSFVVVWSSYGQDGPSVGVFAQRFCPPLGTVTVGVSGSTTVCTTSTAGIATVSDSGGGFDTHQWYQGPPATFPTPISGETGLTYLITGSDFPGPGGYLLSCLTTPQCGSPTFSNAISISVIADSAPIVTPPPAITASQTLCQ